MIRMSEQVASTSFDAQLDALGHVSRRRLLRSLANASADGELPLRFDRDAEDGLDRNALLSMRHVHLPKLEAHGFIDANPERHTVDKGPRFEEIRPLVELLDANRERLPPDWV